MHDFLKMIFGLLQQGMALAISVVVLCAGAFLIAAFVHRCVTKGQKRFPLGKAILALLLAGYLAVLLYATLLRYTGGYRAVNLHLFRAWRKAWNSFSLQNWLNVLLNVALFVPLGVLLPFLVKVFRKWYFMLCAGFGTSLLIETVQYFTGRGLFDVDDLFTNTLGAMLGFCIAMFFAAVFRKDGIRKTKSIPYAVVPVCFAAVLCCIFIVHSSQEYGVLPDAPAFVANVKGVEWSLECELSTEKQIVATYRTEPMNKKSCNAFAAEFAERLGITFPDVSYSDSSAIFMNHSTGDFLYVSYLDGSYFYTSGGNDDLDWAEYDEETLREMLAKFDISIPETAEFYHGAVGSHTFYVDMELAGDTLINGNLNCKCRENETLDEIDNHLTTFTFHKDVEIISQAEAYDLLCQGRFSGGDFFDYYAPQNVTVTSCALQYRIDTKGFYQPVYVFFLTMDETTDSILIVPAMQ